MNVRIILYSVLLFGCSYLSAQTKFTGVVIDQSYTTFCSEISKKYKLLSSHPKVGRMDSDITYQATYFHLTFLGIEDCYMNVYSKDGTNRVCELEITIPLDESVESYGERGLKQFIIGTKHFKHIFKAYRTKYGDKYECYVREDNIMVEWKLPDVKIQLKITKLTNAEDDVYRWTKVHYFVEKNNIYKSTTIDDI